METHVECAALSPGVDWPCTRTMWCGAQCEEIEGAPFLLPAGFDFYDEKHAHKADCQACKAVLGAMRCALRVAVQETC